MRTTKRLATVILAPVALALIVDACAARRMPEENAAFTGGSRTALPDRFVARVVQSGAIECFPKGLKNPDGSTATCELSGAAIAGDRLVVANDKPIPGEGRSPVFAVPWEGTLPRISAADRNVYFTAAPFTGATKYEDVAVSPDGSYFFATTGMDRFDPNSPKFDAFDTLLFWPAGKEKDVSVVMPSERGGVASSADLWRMLSRAQKTAAFPDGLPYFKTEGLAVLPGDTLLYGVREAGKDFKDFTYTVRIISIPFMIRDCHALLGDEAKVVWEMTGEQLAKKAGLPDLIGLSGLAYDKYHARLYLLTSFEPSQTEPLNGAYLWIMTMDALRGGGMPDLVHTPDGKPLRFTHKAEGVAVIDGGAVLVIHDDDRVTGHPPMTEPEKGPKRELHQSFYDIVRFE